MKVRLVLQKAAAALLMKYKGPHSPSILQKELVKLDSCSLVKVCEMHEFSPVKMNQPALFILQFHFRFVIKLFFLLCMFTQTFVNTALM